MAVDLFTSKTYVYSMKSRNLSGRKFERFYQDIQPKRQQTAKNEKLRFQTDLEFQQNEIKKLNLKCNVKLLAFVCVEEKHTQPNRKLENSKNFFFEANGCIKQVLLKVSIKKKIICKATENMNSTHLQKYGYAPDTVEEKAT